jgi:hypothetical protein
MTNRENSDPVAWRRKIESGGCIFPDCERPSDDPPNETLPMCSAHLESNNAQADLDEVQLALNVLAPWIDSCDAIGMEPLTKVMKEAITELREQKEAHVERIARAERELAES